ncbi:MAG: DNA-binding response regulator [Candidatus Omnitrophota bacterium]|jgi:two-component system alkaline phosphatase synthesis response regulator PhoP|nr:MAG: DNA-binding response regulator [Candidatus Omnitrophota bacterium]
MSRILIVEDEPDMRRGLKDNLEFEGYETVTTANGTEGLRMALKEDFDLIILDLMLPGMDGMDVCRKLKESGSTTPMIMLTARGAEEDKISGLEAGADDYITKPFSLKEMLARVKVILRRATQDRPSIHDYTFGSIVLSFDKYKATRNGQPLDLSPREFEMMRLFVENEGKVVNREQFLEQVWGYTTVPSTRTVDNHIAKLRQKIERDAENPQHIITVHRMGYKFIP